MHHLSGKELMHLEDHLNMEELMVKKLTQCQEMAVDPEVKNICGQFIQNHKNNFQTIVKHIKDKNLQ
ncbi:hypothetical protein [Candidatus Contubernalis alkaliaceticus]|uniref:hypothetical protein n=1 Tax=Candidatus Contubernalis alkaliaceticus TaxID=338645 RepID=UPI001F4C0D12|nr:hypothetical protein [Candidatus Contubernalis alkalaceticus]UNC92381.1 spore coat protein [Candidatus Contubernalis alkalaceticus]